MSLRGLPTLTALQRLHLDVKGSSTGDAAELADALPHLAQHLTALQLRGQLTADACLAGLSSLTNLQALNLRDFRCTTASCARLPRSLTRLALEGPGGNVTPFEDAAEEEDEAFPAFVMDPDSTPGIASLTSLEELTVHMHRQRPVQLHVAVLTALTRLTRLEGQSCTVTSRPGQPTLSALTALTRLQHLDLDSFTEQAVPTPADYAALTSSPVLASLDLTTHRLRPALALQPFPAQRILTSLTTLLLIFHWLEDSNLSQDSIVSHCPNLRSLSICANGGHDVAAVSAFAWKASFATLSALTELTRLRLTMLEVALTPGVIGAITAIPALRELCIDSIDADDLGCLMQLTAATQLTMLDVKAMQYHGDDDDNVFAILCTNQAPEGSPPDVWRQFPALVLSGAAAHLDDFASNTKAVQSLLNAAAAASQTALQRQSTLEQRVGYLEQQVVTLQGSLTAVLAHLQLCLRLRLELCVVSVVWCCCVVLLRLRSSLLVVRTRKLHQGACTDS